MNKYLKFLLHVVIFFITLSLLLLIMKHIFGIFRNEFPWYGSIGGTSGYAFVLYQNNKKNRKNLI